MTSLALVVAKALPIAIPKAVAVVAAAGADKQAQAMTAPASGAARSSEGIASLADAAATLQPVFAKMLQQASNSAAQTAPNGGAGAATALPLLAHLPASFNVEEPAGQASSTQRTGATAEGNARLSRAGLGRPAARASAARTAQPDAAKTSPASALALPASLPQLPTVASLAALPTVSPEPKVDASSTTAGQAAAGMASGQRSSAPAGESEAPSPAAVKGPAQAAVVAQIVDAKLRASSGATDIAGHDQVSVAAQTQVDPQFGRQIGQDHAAARAQGGSGDPSVARFAQAGAAQATAAQDAATSTSVTQPTVATTIEPPRPASAQNLPLVPVTDGPAAPPASAMQSWSAGPTLPPPPPATTAARPLAAPPAAANAGPALPAATKPASVVPTGLADVAPAEATGVVAPATPPATMSAAEPTSPLIAAQPQVQSAALSEPPATLSQPLMSASQPAAAAPTQGTPSPAPSPAALPAERPPGPVRAASSARAASEIVTRASAAAQLGAGQTIAAPRIQSADAASAARSPSIQAENVDSAVVLARAASQPQAGPSPAQPAAVTHPAAEAFARANNVITAEQAIQDAPVAPAATLPASLAVPGGVAVPAAAGPPTAAHTAAGQPAATGAAALGASQLDSIANAVRLAAAGNGRRLTVSLSPRELGTVEISVARQEGGAATVTLSVERPETLALLRRDSAALQSALDQAGLSVPSHHLTMALAASTPATPTATPGGGGAGPDTTLNAGAGSFGGETRTPSHRADERAEFRNNSPGTSPDTADLPSIPVLTTTRSSRGGLDITA